MLTAASISQMNSVNTDENQSSPAVPIFVDLDGTLIHGDTLHESALELVKKNPLNLFKLVLWVLTCSRAELKHRIAEQIFLDPEGLAYNRPLLDWLETKRRAGHKIHLATAAHQRIADAVARHLGVFTSVLATTASQNLKGAAKLAAIQAHEQTFWYAGDHKADFPIWEKSAGAIVAGTSDFKNQVSRKHKVVAWFQRTKISTKSVAKTIRIHQWAKNSLVFSTLLLSHQYGNVEKLFQAFLAFAAFSFVASSVYIVNDLFDLKSDRQHKEKCKRPIPSGAVSIPTALGLGICLFVAGVTVGMATSSHFLVVILLYFATTTAYSFGLKAVPLVDIFILAFLYAWRIFAGSIATETPVSGWLLIFSLFFFLSLGVVKRVTELQRLTETKKNLVGRGYDLRDLETLRSLGIAAGLGAVCIFSLYIYSPAVEQLYSSTEYLIICLSAILFWIFRVWIKVGRNDMHSDPIVFAITDRVSHGLLVIALFSIFLARYM